MNSEERRSGVEDRSVTKLASGRGQLHQTLDKTVDLSDVRAEVCVSVAWPGGGLKRGHT